MDKQAASVCISMWNREFVVTFPEKKVEEYDAVADNYFAPFYSPAEIAAIVAAAD